MKKKRKKMNERNKGWGMQTNQKEIKKRKEKKRKEKKRKEKKRKEKKRKEKTTGSIF